MDVFIDVVQVLNLTYLDKRFPLSGSGLEGGELSSGFVLGSGIRCGVLMDRFIGNNDGLYHRPDGLEAGVDGRPALSTAQLVQRLQHLRDAVLEERVVVIREAASCRGNCPQCTRHSPGEKPRLERCASLVARTFGEFGSSDAEANVERARFASHCDRAKRL